MKDLNRYLSFALGKEEYAIPLLKVKEVIAMPEVTPVPFTPPHFLGIMNLRGQVISIIDLRKKLGMGTTETTAETPIIIANLEPLYLGVVVDSVNKVLSLTAAELSSAPEFLEGTSGAAITGVARKDSKLILLLDIAKTLNVEDLTVLQQNGQKAG